jgi:hypothetical protein
MKQNSMANSQWRTGLLAFVTLVLLAAGISACDRAPERPPQEPTAQVAPTPVPNPPPTAAAVTEGARPREGASANDQPMKSMTKAEESNSMPMPGQANDHSTVAKDSKK